MFRKKAPSPSAAPPASPGPDDSKMSRPGADEGSSEAMVASHAVSDDDAPLKMPADTAQELASADIGGEGAGSAENAASSDELLLRMIVSRGLATQEEVGAAAEARKTSREGLRKPLAWTLINQQVITPNQFERLRASIEANATGHKIPGYRVIGKLGEGTSAAVFKARQINLDRLVAIKVLPRRFSTNKKFVEQLYAEGRAAAQLNHANVVQAYDVGHSGDFHYFVMEFVEGPTLHDVIQQEKRIEEERAIRIVIDVADALAHAHAQGLVHRDIKPRNIIITAAGVPKVADLGLARALADKATALAERGKVLGTPYYMPPEQIRGEEHIGPPADIYSLGATFYYMLTGRVPYEGDDGDEVIAKHLNEELTPPNRLCADLTPGVCEIIEKMMAKDPARRYATCDELLVELRAWKAYHVLRRGETRRG